MRSTTAAARPRRRFEWIGIWPLLALAVLAPLNFLGIAVLLGSSQVGVAPDFQQYADAWDRLLAGERLYGPDWKWRYSPAALLFIGPATEGGLLGWTILHFAAVAFIRPWPLAALFALSWPFWVDVVSGNSVTFVAVAGIAAMRGSNVGTYAYWWLTLLMPRPVQLPLAAYLFWRRPEARRGLVVLTAVNVVLLVIVGHVAEWIAYLMTRGTENIDAVFNIHPGAELGAGWLLIGLPIAAVLVWRGWPAQAGLFVSPSLLAQYLVIALVPPDRARTRANVATLRADSEPDDDVPRVGISDR